MSEGHYKRMNIKPKGLNEFLHEDKTLTRKITYEEFSRVESGFDDSRIDEAYEVYKKAIKQS